MTKDYIGSFLRCNKAIPTLVENYCRAYNSEEEFFAHSDEFFDKLFSILDGIAVKDGYRLSLDVVHVAFEGYYTTIGISDNNGLYIDSALNDISSYLVIDNRLSQKVIAWQVYLLNCLYRLFCYEHSSPEYAAVPAFSHTVFNHNSDMISIECVWQHNTQGNFKEVSEYRITDDSIRLIHKSKEPLGICYIPR